MLERIKSVVYATISQREQTIGRTKGRNSQGV